MDCKLSQLPFFPCDLATGDTLPPKHSSICQSCWEGPFAAHLGLFSVLIEEIPGHRARFIGGHSYSTSISQLEGHADAGCVWCRFLLGYLGKDSAKFKWPDERVKIRVGNPAKPKATYTPANSQTLSVIINGHHRFEGYVHTIGDNPAAPFITWRSRIRDVGSPYALSLARECIDECVQSHQRCIPLVASTDPLLPTHVVDCTDPERPRLTLTGGRRGKYLALSYVWGEAQPHSTTERNVDTYTSIGIDPALLPQTIRDAIRIAHALGFQYLWADCLCIIQDSDEDKRHELGCMHYIYRYAHLTIIAASARTVSEGFLQNRPPAPRDIALPFICPTPLSGSGESLVGEVHVSQTWTRRADHPPYHRHWDPISARGWCMQEYFMSPRALIFTSETLRFMCPTIMQNVGTTHYKPQGELRLPSVLFLPDPPSLAPRSEKWAKLYRGWCRIVEDYSQRTVGRASDKLVACGAIAEAFARVLDSGYLAGLWRATLLQDVLWRRSLGAYVHRPAGYRAPSWSWAAVDGRVKTLWGSPLEWTAVAEVVRCEVVLEDPKLRFGQVTGGVLVVRAPLVQCKLRPNAKSHDILLSTASSWHVLNWGDHGLNATAEEEGLDWAFSGWAKIDSAADAEIQTAWIVPLLRSETERLEDLVIALVGTDGPEAESGGTYRRIGCFTLRSSDTLDIDPDGLPWMEVALV